VSVSGLGQQQKAETEEEMTELSDAQSNDSSHEEYEIQVDMLDYGYIEACEDSKTLRGIMKVLESGKEGIYPEVV
jgi:hypothetical protein